MAIFASNQIIKALMFGIALKKQFCLKIIKLEFSLKLKIKCNDWLLVDTCPQAANHCALF